MFYQVAEEEMGMGKTTQLIPAVDGDDKEYDQGDHVDDIYNGIDVMKQKIIEKAKETSLGAKMTNKIQVINEINPTEIKAIGTSMSKLPMAIEIENPYRDAQILHQMASATSKDEVN